MVLEPPAGTVGFLFLRSATGRVLASGVPVAGDKLVVLPPGSEIDLTTPDLTGSEAFGIPVARFDETAETLCPTLGRVRPEGMTVLEGNPAQLQNLARAVLGLVAQDRDPESEEVSNLLANTILWMEGGSGESRPDGFPVARARRRVAKLAQEFIEEFYRETVRTEDLCRVTGVSARVLQRCFREYFDMTCTEYLKAVRLDAAFRALVAAHPANGTVTEVAVHHGFNHLGRFAVEFRQRFGQLPRDALAMQSGRT
jgi:AraC-like DNA-binding protein